MITIDNGVLKLSDDDWEKITDAADKWGEDTFTTDEVDTDRLAGLAAAVTELSGQLTGNAELADVARQLPGEVTARTPVVVATTTVVTTTTDDATPAPVTTDTDIPEPPVGGPAVSTYVPKPVSDEGYYVQPAAHTKVVPFLGGKIPLRNKNLVDLAVKAYYGVNREDIVADIGAQYQAVTKKAYQEPEGTAAIKTSKRPGYKDTDSIITKGGGGYPDHWPVVPSGNIEVHGESVTVFQEFGEPGQAFTGIVRFGGRSSSGAPNDPKIILFPTQAEGDYLSGGVKRHPDEADKPEVLAKSKVYGTTPGEYTTHAGQGAQSSHGKLSAHVQEKEKYAALAIEGQSYQASGLTIGFTVIKGGSSTANKYSFVSRSSNNPVFALVSPVEENTLSGNPALNRLRAERAEQFKNLGSLGDGSLTREWADKIISSVDAAMS